MLRHSYHPLILTIIGLAILGIGYRLVASPGAFFTQILVTIGIVAVLILVMRKFVLPRIMGSQAAYGQQQQGMYTQKSQPAKRPTNFSSKAKEKKKRISRPLVKRQSNVKLTVIEGKKNKKKNRALF